jgi:hypothetical protein
VEACVLALAHRVPVCVRVDHRPPHQPAVEVRESGGIAAFQATPLSCPTPPLTTVNLLALSGWDRCAPRLRPPARRAARAHGAPSARGDARTGSRSSAARSRTHRPTGHVGLIRPWGRSVGTCTR